MTVEKARPVTPLGILTEHLETAVRMLDKQSGVSAEITTHLHKALRDGLTIIRRVQ